MNNGFSLNIDMYKNLPTYFSCLFSDKTQGTDNYKFNHNYFLLIPILVYIVISSDLTD